MAIAKMAEFSSERVKHNRSYEIRILQLNCQRSACVMHDLDRILQKESIDIALLQEPWTYGCDTVGLPGNVRKFNSENEKASIIVCNDVFDCLKVNNLTDDYGVRIWARTPIAEMRLVSRYCQYGGDIEQDIDAIANIYMESQGLPLLIGMDANACSKIWFSKDTRGNFRGIAGYRGNILEEWIVAREINILNQPSNVFTFSGPRGSSDIDVTYGLGLGDIVINWNVKEVWGLSDHNPVLITMDKPVSLPLEEQISWSLTGVRWNLYRAYLEEEAETFGFGQFLNLDPEAMASCIRNWLIKTNDYCLQKKKKRLTVDRWLDGELKRMRKSIRRLRKKHQKQKRKGDNDAPL